MKHIKTKYLKYNKTFMLFKQPSKYKSIDEIINSKYDKEDIKRIIADISNQASESLTPEPPNLLFYTAPTCRKN